MSEQHRWHHPDWNKPEGQQLREQPERSKRVRAEWRLTERKDARVAAFIVVAVCAFLLLPVCMRWLHIPMQARTYMPEWMWQYLP